MEDACKDLTCFCRYSKWQIDSRARRLEQESLVDRLRQLLHENLHQSQAVRVTAFDDVSLTVALTSQEYVVRNREMCKQCKKILLLKHDISEFVRQKSDLCDT